MGGLLLIDSNECMMAVTKIYFGNKTPAVAVVGAKIIFRNANDV